MLPQFWKRFEIQNGTVCAENVNKFSIEIVVNLSYKKLKKLDLTDLIKASHKTRLRSCTHPHKLGQHLDMQPE